MASVFTRQHRGGDGPPLVLIHGFTDTWRTWELVLAALERKHEVLAPTLTCHAGGPRADGEVLHPGSLADGVERAMDEAGFETAHIAGNSLGGHVTLQLAARGRARSAVALAPAGGWEGDDWPPERTTYFTQLYEGCKRAAPHADAIMATPEGRRRATAFTSVRYEHIPAELLAHQLCGVAGCDVPRLIDLAERGGYEPIDYGRIECPVRVVWGTEDRILRWPGAAARHHAGLPQADWVELDDVGHCPQLDVPAVTADLILGITAR